MNRIQFILNPLVFILISLTYCTSKETMNVTITGTVIDSISGYPLENVEIVALGWKKNGFNDVNYKLIKVRSDSKGQFSLKFERAFRIDIGTNPQGYLVTHQTFSNLKGENFVVYFKLKKGKKKSSAVYLNPEIPEDEGLFWGMRDYHLKDNSHLEIWGFDMDAKKATTSEKEAEIWIKSSKNGLDSNWILEARNDWQIKPIQIARLEENLAYTMFSAPEKGYTKNYEITGSEKGYFLKNMNDEKYVKIVLSPYKIKGSSPYKDGYYEEIIQSFHIVYNPNGSRNLYIEPKIDLEFYLIGLPW